MSNKIFSWLNSTQFLIRLKQNEEALSWPLDEKASRWVSDKMCNFLVIRRWNSFSPLMHSGDVHSRGGGYILVWHGKVVIIDPGCDFIVNFHEMGFKVADIDAIIITHSHVDHFHDFEALLSLLYEVNQRIKDNRSTDSKTYKKVNVYASLGVLKKWSGWMELDHFRQEGAETPLGRIHALDPSMSQGNATIILGDEGKAQVKIVPTPALHDEKIAKNYSVGLIFELTHEEDKAKPPLKIGLTSDTTWTEEIARNYLSCDILGLHLGSIKEQEFRGEPYEKHLGILGCIRLLGDPSFRYQIAIMSEFGEELKGLRWEIMTALRQSLPSDLEKKVICGDIGTTIDLKNMSLCCERPGCNQKAEFLDVFEKNGLARHYCQQHMPVSYLWWKEKLL